MSQHQAIANQMLRSTVVPAGMIAVVVIVDEEACEWACNGDDEDAERALEEGLNAVRVRAEEPDE